MRFLYASLIICFFFFVCLIIIIIITTIIFAFFEKFSPVILCANTCIPSNIALYMNKCYARKGLKRSTDIPTEHFSVWKMPRVSSLGFFYDAICERTLEKKKDFPYEEKKKEKEWKKV